MKLDLFSELWVGAGRSGCPDFCEPSGPHPDHSSEGLPLGGESSWAVLKKRLQIARSHTWGREGNQRAGAGPPWNRNALGLLGSVGATGWAFLLRRSGEERARTQAGGQVHDGWPFGTSSPGPTPCQLFDSYLISESQFSLLKGGTDILLILLTSEGVEGEMRS